MDSLDQPDVFQADVGAEGAADDHAEQHHDLLPLNGATSAPSSIDIKHGTMVHGGFDHLRALVWYSRAFLVSLVARVVYSTALSTWASILAK